MLGLLCTHILPRALLPITILLLWDISCVMFLNSRLTLGKAGNILAMKVFWLPEMFKILKSYCKMGENIYPTGKEGDGAILCFIHQLVLGEEKGKSVIVNRLHEINP